MMACLHVWSCSIPIFHQSRRYKGLKEGELPICESLKDTIARALPFWNEVIVPEIKAGKNVIIAAHGNSLRGIVKHLESEYHPTKHLVKRLFRESIGRVMRYLIEFQVSSACQGTSTYSIQTHRTCLTTRPQWSQMTQGLFIALIHT